MAKQTLPTNFKDDILAPSMGGKRKYRIIDNGDDTYSFEDVTDYTQTGSGFGAGQINATNQAVNESCDKANVIETMDDIVANQASGMIAGAKAVAELKGNINQKVNKNDIYDGETTLTGRANAVVSATLTFSDHGTVPRVFLTARASNPGNIRELSVSNITRTSMTINLYRTDAVDTPIQYLIIW